MIEKNRSGWLYLFAALIILSVIMTAAVSASENPDGEASRETSSSSRESSRAAASSEETSSRREASDEETSQSDETEAEAESETEAETEAVADIGPTQPSVVVEYVEVEATTETVERIVETADGSARVEATSYMARAEAAAALMNEEREGAGLPPLAYDAFLEETALLRALELSFQFSHERPDGTAWHTVAGNPGNAACELLGRGMEDETAAVEAWMASPGHRAGLMNEGYTRIGIASVEVGGELYWASLFGA